MGGVLLWRGCTYPAKLVEELEALLRVLNHAKVDFSILEDEKCCGYPLILLGRRDLAKEIAEENSKKLNKYSLVITPCPACFRMFSQFYPTLGAKTPEIMHVSQFLHKLMQEKRIDASELKPVKLKVMYHDPCELGRHMGVYEEPRKILAEIPGLSLYEQRFVREKSVCCGGGSLLPVYTSSLSAMVAARKLLEEDRIPEDLDAIVTTCPQCILNIRQGIRWISEEKPINVRVYNLAQILDMSLRGETQ